MSTKPSSTQVYSTGCDICGTKAPQGKDAGEAKKNAEEAGFLVLHNLDLCAACIKTIVIREIDDLRQKSGATP